MDHEAPAVERTELRSECPVLGAGPKQLDVHSCLVPTIEEVADLVEVLTE